ncbi:MAG: hypothetical protein K7J46_22405 [Bryobacter sp.]|jgi:hypothetical protein|nr:hypothetical protein [Bryobacter sp. CoA8 C33]
MVANIQLDEDGIVWLNRYAAEVCETFGTEFVQENGRFGHWKPLLHRFSKAVDNVLTRGRGHFGAVEEAHNEICIASALLANLSPRFLHLEYEPLLPGCAKSIDFRASAEDGTVVYVDVKTIRPAAIDRWEQYETAQQQEWLPDNGNVILFKEWLGGELWHSMLAARGRMLEYALELETKIAESKLSAANTFFVMAFCGEGFHWHLDELEDFVSFYSNGRHRADDLFSKAELKYMSEKQLRLNRNITSFASMSRPQGATRQRPIHWNVQPPRDGFA